MSKSAAKYIRNNVSGRIADLCLDTLYSPDVRKNWRNADVLARFLIDTVANAYQCENSTTFADNGHADMEDAISSYIEANLCDWDQAKFLASSFGKQTAEEITARLNEWRTKNTEFEWRQRATQNELVAQQPQSAAEEMQIIFWAANDYVARRNIVEAAHEEALRMNEAHKPCSEAEHNAEYYKLLLASRWRTGQVIMTTKNGAFNYILNDAIAGDMVKSVSLFTYTIDFRDGSVFDLRDGDWMPHGFYASVQAKRC